MSLKVISIESVPSFVKIKKPVLPCPCVLVQIVATLVSSGSSVPIIGFAVNVLIVVSPGC